MVSKVLSVGDKVELTKVQAAQSDASVRKKENKHKHFSL